MQFNTKELETLLSAVAFSASADVCWNITPDVKARLVDLIDRMTLHQVKIGKELYVIDQCELGYEESEVTLKLIADAKIKVEKRKNF